MSPETEPLLAHNRPSSVQSDERAAAEDEALHGTQTTGHTLRNQYGFWRELGLFLWAIAATAAVIVLAVYSHHQEQTSPGNGEKAKSSAKRNLIFMVSDGMGPASLSMTRTFRQYTSGLPIDDVLVLDRHFIGSSRTRSTSSLVTDSAAGATAFSCGMKSYNGAIAMLPDFTPCGTVLEAAKKAGYMTGLVVTTDITDATPACFASHAYFRVLEDSIAEQEIGEHPLGRVVDLILGGGRCHFLPNSTEGSCRQDGKDITKVAQEKFGWKYVNDRAGFDSLELGKAVKLPLLGLFAGSDIPFEIDRRSMQDVYPSLDEMAQTALRALDEATKDSDKGFFLMIEGSRIDHAGHGNDPAAQVHEVLAYDKAFSTVVKFLEESETDGVVVSTSDHETGGLAVARQIRPTYPDYKWLPQFLVNATHSSDYLAALLSMHIASYEGDTIPDKDLKQYIKKTLVEDGLGIHDMEDEELQIIIDHPAEADYILADMISRRAQIGWSTHGHSAVDVNIYGSAGSDALRGNHENTGIGHFLRDYLDVDLDAITKELREKLKDGGTPAQENLIHNESLAGFSNRYQHLSPPKLFPAL